MSGKGKRFDEERNTHKREESRSDEKKNTKRRELDPSSSKFNPLKALYSKDIELPVPNAPAFDNLSKFESNLSGKAATSRPKVAEKKLTFDELPPRDLTNTYQNVMKWMREVTGPMKVLRDCMENRVKVKVVTRAAASIRGYITGYVTSFDKIWNMTVEDATEVWTRRKKKKTVPIGGSAIKAPPDVAGKRMAAPPIKITSINKKFERCERFVSKILVKGEHVVLVSVFL